MKGIEPCLRERQSLGEIALVGIFEFLLSRASRDENIAPLAFPEPGSGIYSFQQEVVGEERLEEAQAARAVGHGVRKLRRDAVLLTADAEHARSAPVYVPLLTGARRIRVEGRPCAAGLEVVPEKPSPEAHVEVRHAPHRQIEGALHRLGVDGGIELCLKPEKARRNLIRDGGHYDRGIVEGIPHPRLVFPPGTDKLLFAIPAAFRVHGTIIGTKESALQGRAPQ